MRTLFLARLLAPLTVLLSVSANAQGASCKRENLSNPSRLIYRCANGLVLEGEVAADLRLTQTPGQKRPATATISSKAVLVEVKPGSGAFQILTPQAIAAVRGTVYIVDVANGTTSVFVMRGKVSVSIPDGSQSVVLKPGEGTDVSAGQPLTPKVWGKKRASRLLARFAR
jgi:hypothetical protein